MATRMTELQKLFVEAYCGPANFNATEAMKQAGYQHNDSRIHVKASLMLQHPGVSAAIRKRLDKRKGTFWLQEDQILEKLWEEAQKEGSGTSHAARINALVWLGKHLGMWQERFQEKEEASVTYNIVNYGTVPERDVKEKIEQNRDEIERVREKVNLPEGVVIADYSGRKQ